MVDLSGVPDLPASALSSLAQFNELIETYAQHRLPQAYIDAIVSFTAFHGGECLLVIPIFARQITSGRFWIGRLASTPRGRIIVPNHLDCSAVMIGAYVAYDLGFHIKLLLCYHELSSQRGLPALLLLRFVFLTTIGWIFLICFFLVLVPPSSFKLPALVWNVGIFAVPTALHLGGLYLLVDLTRHWNAYWSKYEALAASIRQAQDSGATLPTSDQIETARHMLGIDLSRYSHSTRNWAFVYYAWTLLFMFALLFVTVQIVRIHWSRLRDSTALPMQSRPVDTFIKPGERSGNARIHRWMRRVPQRASYRTDTERLETILSGDGTETEPNDTVARSMVKLDPISEDDPTSPRQGQNMPTGRRLLIYFLGLEPLHKDAYDDPTRGFSEHKALAGLRSLLVHTAIQGTAVAAVAVLQLMGVFLVTRHGVLQPLATNPEVAGRWGVEWVQTLSIYRLLEAWGTGLPGLVIVVSILMRQRKAINLSQARANQGIVAQRRGLYSMGATAADLHLSAPGPSVSMAFAAGMSRQQGDAMRGTLGPATLGTSGRGICLEQEGYVSFLVPRDQHSDASTERHIKIAGRLQKADTVDTGMSLHLSTVPGTRRTGHAQSTSVLEDDTVVDDGQQ